MQREADLQPNVSILGGDCGESGPKPRLPLFDHGSGRERSIGEPLERPRPSAARRLGGSASSAVRCASSLLARLPIVGEGKSHCGAIAIARPTMCVPLIRPAVRVNAWRRDDVSAIGPNIEAASLAARNRSAIGRELEIEMAALVRDDAVRRRECAKPLSEFEKEFCSLEAVDIDNDQPAPRSSRNADVRVRRARPPIPDLGFVARRVFETMLRDWLLAAWLARENGEPVAGIAEGEVDGNGGVSIGQTPHALGGGGGASSAAICRDFRGDFSQAFSPSRLTSQPNASAAAIIAPLETYCCRSSCNSRDQRSARCLSAYEWNSPMSSVGRDLPRE